MKAEPTSEIIKRLEQQMSSSASNMVDPGMVSVRISDLRRILTELERARGGNVP